ncbi:hypothetical protein EG329_011889 [Mollisiaceae sp. DMI_Dod_QoI]|nr:hypothetical protein EG329_011889 [Helotiales sp. DMI_Dod_QoI]
MPRKTGNSILAHVERLRKVREAQATYKTSTAFKKPAPKPAQLRPASRPVSRVPSTTSTLSSSSSRVARTERSVEAHIERVSRARVKSSPISSSRPSPVNSRKVSPIQPLQVKKRLPVVDLAQVSDSLAELSIQPLSVAPRVPTLRSCLKTEAALKPKVVHFVEYGGWNLHGIRTFQPDSPPNTFIPPSDAEILQPLHRQVGDVYPGSYRLVGQTSQIRWPPPDDGPSRRGYDSLPPSRCPLCAKAAARGTSRIRYRPQQVSVWCSACMASPARRPHDDGHDDEEDDCYNVLHHHYPDTCAYFRNGWKANVRWLYDHYPE